VILRLHLVRLARARRPVAAALLMVLFLGLMLLGFWTYAQDKSGGRAEFRYTYENESYFTGLTFAVYAFYFGFLLILPVLVATEGAIQVAGEAADGTLRLLLGRPLSRARLFLTKLAVATGFGTWLTFLLLTLSLTVGLLLVGWGDLDLYPGVLQMTAEHQHLEQRVALVRFVLAWPAASLALLAPLALALLVAAWVRSPVQAVGVSVSLYLALYVVSQVHFFEALRPWLFTSSMTYWRGLFQEQVDWARLGREAARLVGFSSLFLALAAHRFRTREESA
jgi:ABC-2 type transport system permease protein